MLQIGQIHQHRSPIVFHQSCLYHVGKDYPYPSTWDYELILQNFQDSEIFFRHAAYPKNFPALLLSFRNPIALGHRAFGAACIFAPKWVFCGADTLFYAPQARSGGEVRPFSVAPQARSGTFLRPENRVLLKKITSPKGENPAFFETVGLFLKKNRCQGVCKGAKLLIILDLRSKQP